MEKENMHKFVSPDGKYMAVYMPRDNSEDVKRRDELAKPILAEKSFFDAKKDLPKDVFESLDFSNVVVAIMEKDGSEWKKIDVVKLYDDKIRASAYQEPGYYPENCPEIISVGKNHVIAENYSPSYGGYDYQIGMIKNENGEWLSTSIGDTRVSQHVIVNEGDHMGDVYFFDAKTAKVEDTGYKRPMLWSHLDYAGIDKDGFTCDTLTSSIDDDPYSNKNFGKHAYVKRQSDGSYKEDFVSDDFIVKCEFMENAYFTTPSLRNHNNTSLYINGEKADENICGILDAGYIKDNGAVMKINEQNRPEILGSIKGRYNGHLGNALISSKDEVNYINYIGKNDVFEVENTTDSVSIENVYPNTHDLVQSEKDMGEPAIVIFQDNDYDNVKKVYNHQDLSELSNFRSSNEGKYGMKYSREIDMMTKKGRDIR